MQTYICRDGGTEISIQAESAQDAANQFVEGGDWGDGSETIWVTVWVREAGADERDEERYTVTIEATEPKCASGTHEWDAPHAIVGGLKENPGVFGHGGGVRIHEICMRCGCGKLTDTWAQDTETGEQGLTSVSYTPGQYTDDLADLVDAE